MTRTQITRFVLLIAFLALPAEAAILLRLRVEPPSQLPAIEPSLRVEAINTGSEPVTLPRTVASDELESISARGEQPRVRGKPDRRLRPRPEREVARFVRRKHDRRRILVIRMEPGDVIVAAQTRVCHERLPPSPGRDLHDDKLDSERLDDLERVVDQPGLGGPVVSNEASYVVEAPQGAMTQPSGS